MPYYLNGKANGEELLLSQPNARKCPTCEMYTHRWEDRGDLTTKLRADFGFTREGFQVVSQKFRDIVTGVGVRDVTFLPLSNGSWILRPERVIFLDLSEAADRVLGPCPTCARTTAILGHPPVARILPGQEKVGHIDMFRSGQAFGGDYVKIEFTIFGDEIMEALNDEGLKGGVMWHAIPQD